MSTPRPRGPVVTLDGPAGSGKSTTAREVARRLGFRHLDSGALYRALTFALLEADRGPETWPSLREADFSGLDVRIVPIEGGFEVRLGDRVLGPELRTERVTARVSALARIPAARAALLELQREAGRHGCLVADGRDLGTVVFPDADVKVFLSADLRERARRRLLERSGGAAPTSEDVSREAQAIDARDRRDTERETAPLRRPADAVDVDTTGLSFEEQVRTVVSEVRARTGR